MGLMAHIVKGRSKKKVKEFKIMLDSPQETQEAVLEEIISKNVSTKFGEDHNFSSVSNVSKFQDQVPLRSYEQFHREYINKLMNNPNESILSSSKLIHWFITSGGKKHIPFTDAAYARNKKDAQYIIMHFINDDPEEHSKIFDGNLLSWAAPPIVDTLNGIPVGYKSGFAMSRGNWFTNHLMAVPNKIQFMGDWEKKYRKVIDLALKKKITSIGGLTSILAVLLEKIDERDVKLKEQWPHMQVFMTGGVDVDHYRDTFRKFFPDTHIRDNFGASEVDFGFEMDDNDGLVPIYDAGFFEIIPVDIINKEREGKIKSRDMDAVPITSLKKSDVGELVFTGLNGLYRYRMGDLIRCVGENPLRFKFHGRVEDEINLSGEKFKTSYLGEVVSSASQKEGLQLHWWVPSGFDKRYHFVVCFEKEPSKESVGRFIHSIEKDLLESGEYTLLRGGVLKSPIVKIVPFGEIDRLIMESGVHPDQFKFRPVSKNVYNNLAGNEYSLDNLFL